MVNRTRVTLPSPFCNLTVDVVSSPHRAPGPWNYDVTSYYVHIAFVFVLFLEPDHGPVEPISTSLPLATYKAHNMTWSTIHCILDHLNRANPGQDLGGRRSTIF